MDSESEIKYHHFKIKSGIVGKDTTIEMDGTPLKGVTDIRVKTCMDDVNKVIITFIPRGIDLELDGVVDAFQRDRPNLREPPPVERRRTEEHSEPEEEDDPVGDQQSKRPPRRQDERPPITDDANQQEMLDEFDREHDSGSR